MRRWSLLLVFLLATAGAAPAQSSTRWVTHKASNHTFRLAAPSTWIDFTRATPEVVRRARVDPALRPYLDLAIRQHAIKLVLVDQTGPTRSKGFATNVNVTQVQAGGSLESERRATVAQFKSLHVLVGGIRSSHVRLPAGRAVRLVFHARYARTLPILAQTQFILVHAGTANYVTYTTLPSAEGGYRGTFDRSARTLRFA